MRKSFDIDGVIYLGPEVDGVYPGPNDIIITGRSFQESDYTYKMLHERHIYNRVYFNPTPFEEKTREDSGNHKAWTIRLLNSLGYGIGIHIEDDPIQAEIISKETKVKIILLQHDLIEKENTWHGSQEDRNLILGGHGLCSPPALC